MVDNTLSVFLEIESVQVSEENGGFRVVKLHEIVDQLVGASGIRHIETALVRLSAVGPKQDIRQSVLLYKARYRAREEARRGLSFNEDGYPAYMNFVEQYAGNLRAHQLFYDHVRFIIGRTNRYTGKRYADDTTIMSWQIGNEPRAFSKQALPAFKAWLREASALIRTLDPNHLISIGTEGPWGCEGETETFEDICADPNIDYTNVHVWPYNWGWAKSDSLVENVQWACDKSRDYIMGSLEVSKRLGKPMVMEEFGYPRDGFSFSRQSTTAARDAYYRYIFSMIEADAKVGGSFAGCNFWGWGGLAKPRHEQWQPGDDYTGDPAQEQQGLNSVFASDRSTLKIINGTIRNIKKIKHHRQGR